MTRILAALGAVALLSSAAAPAHAQSFRELMEDIGLQKRKQENINYDERAPLVVPPSLQALPAPEDKAALAGANPSWPKDPDEVRAAEELEREKIPEHLRRKYNPRAAQMIYAIRQDEAKAADAAAGTSDYDTALRRRDPRMSPDELKKVQREQAADGKSAEAVVMTEPERKRLTDPPAGYRMPSPAQPYGPGEKEKKAGWLSKMNPFN